MNEPDNPHTEPIPAPEPTPKPEPSPAPESGTPAPAPPRDDPPRAADDDGSAPAAGDDARPKRRRRRRRSRGGEQPGEGAAPAPRPMPERPPKRQWERVRPGRDSAHLATQAVRALADMAQQLLRIEGVDPLAMPRYLDLALRVPLDVGKDVKHAASRAVEQILARVREVREHEKALRPGAVYSYFDGSSHADGCRPKAPREVFDGYGSTGKPRFADFVTMAIERKDAGIDRLLSGEDVVLTQVTMGRVLRTQQLAEFGGNSPVFKILGQVNAGLFRVLGAAGKCAFSFQLLRGTTLEGRVRLRLHAVGAVEPMDLADPAIMQILSRFQRRLDTESLRLEGRIQNGDTDEEEFVLPLLNDLARQLQSRTRQAGRRTQHGLERSEEGQRPTSRAYPDAGEAGDDRILWDSEQGTIVVLGPKNRVHVFSPDGKHVTSVVIQGSAVDRRRQLGRWRASEPEERGEFRIQVRRAIARGEEPEATPVPLPAAPRVAERPPVVVASPSEPVVPDVAAPAPESVPPPSPESPSPESPSPESPSPEPAAPEPEPAAPEPGAAAPEPGAEQAPAQPPPAPPQ